MAAGVLPMLLEEQAARDTYAAANGIHNLAALLPSNSLWVRVNPQRGAPQRRPPVLRCAVDGGHPRGALAAVLGAHSPGSRRKLLSI